MTYRSCGRVSALSATPSTSALADTLRRLSARTLALLNDQLMTTASTPAEAFDPRVRQWRCGGGTPAGWAIRLRARGDTAARPATEAQARAIALRFVQVMALRRTIFRKRPAEFQLRARTRGHVHLARLVDPRSGQRRAFPPRHHGTRASAEGNPMSRVTSVLALGATLCATQANSRRFSRPLPRSTLSRPTTSASRETGPCRPLPRESTGLIPEIQSVCQARAGGDHRSAFNQGESSLTVVGSLSVGQKFQQHSGATKGFGSPKEWRRRSRDDHMPGGRVFQERLHACILCRAYEGMKDIGASERRRTSIAAGEEGGTGLRPW